MKHDMRAMRDSKRKSDVLRSLSDLSLLWRKTDPEHSTPADQQGIEDSQVQESSSGLGSARSLGDGNTSVGETGKRGTGAGKENKEMK